jgi:hypothetical protein
MAKASEPSLKTKKRDWKLLAGKEFGGADCASMCTDVRELSEKSTE